jgi:GT2 family glycosyltransferase
MPKQMKKVLIITVSYNSSELLERCLLSALSQEYSGGITVCLVDNQSNDNCLEIGYRLQKKFPKLIVIANHENNGFAGGNNLAIEKYKDTHEYFYLHNPDAYFSNENDIAKLVEVMGQLNDEAVIQPVVRHPNGEIGTSGNIPFYLGLGGTGQAEVGNTKPYEKIGYTSGSAMMFSKKVVDKIGLLEHLYFAYQEDQEFSYRARLAGFESYVASQVSVFHEHEFSKGKFKFYLLERNRYFMLLTYYDVLSLIFLLPVLIILDLMVTAYFIINGWIVTRIRTYKDVWKYRKELSERRKFVSQFKTRDSLLRLYSSLSGKLSTKDLAESGLIAIIFELLNIIFNIYFKIYLFVYKNFISKIVQLIVF